MYRRHHRHLTFRTFSFLVGLFCLLGAQAHADSLEEQRLIYVLALKAQASGQSAVYAPMKQQLRDYPLYPYLLYAELKSRLSSATPGNKAIDQDIETFSREWADTPLPNLLRQSWLRKLIKDNRPQKFLDVYEGRSDPEFECYQQRALIRAGRTEGVAAKAAALWRVGKSQHTACDRLFDWLKQQGGLTQQLIWERVRLAMESGNTSLATWLNKSMEGNIRAWIELWVQTHKQPREGLKHPGLRKDTRLSRLIIAHGLRQLARNDVNDARAYWQRLQQRYAFTADDRLAVEQQIALVAAYRHHPRASEWLRSLPANVELEAATWRVRSALRAQNWPQVMEAIQALAPEERKRSEWNYWRARALAATGDTAGANAIYRQLSTERSYFGFMAADQINAPYAIADQPLVANTADTSAVARLPALVRARELLRTGQSTDAWREIDRATRNMARDDVRRVAALADSWGWHFGAISLASRAGRLDALNARFPTPHHDEVTQAAHAQRLDPAWVYGIIRRESAFRSDARSGAGALGLMQLMPATARDTARRLGVKHGGNRQLLDVSYNIRLGSTYMRQMLDRFENNPVLATAAYNAGPSRILNWLPARNSLPVDVWVDTIVFDETREYVRAVLAYTAIFDWKLGNNVIRLRDRMHPVAAATSG